MKPLSANDLFSILMLPFNIAELVVMSEGSKVIIFIDL